MATVRGRVTVAGAAPSRKTWVVARRRASDASYPYVSEVERSAITTADASGAYSLSLSSRGPHRIVAFEDDAWHAAPVEGESTVVDVKDGPDLLVDVALGAPPRWIRIDPPPSVEIAFPLRTTVGVDAEASTAFVEWTDPETKSTIAALEIDSVVLLDEDVDAKKKRNDVRELFAQMAASGQADEPLAIDEADFEDAIAGSAAYGFSMRGADRRSAYWAIMRTHRIVSSIQCHTFDGSDPRRAAAWLDARLKWARVPA